MSRKVRYIKGGAVKAEYWLLLGLLMIVLSGCRLKRPDDVLPAKKMEQFLYDYHLAQAISQELSRDERYTTQAYIDWAYKKHGITKAEFERSLIWYTRYPNEFSKIYKRLSIRVDDEYKAANKALSQIEKTSFAIQSGDSVSLWYLNHTALLNTSNYMNKLTFRMNRDTTFYSGDTIRLSLRSTFVSVDSIKPQFAYISLSAYYADSLTTADTIMRHDGQIELSVLLDKGKTLSSISGSVNYIDSTQSRKAMLVLTDMDLMRYHDKSLPDTVKSTPIQSLATPIAQP